MLAATTANETAISVLQAETSSLKETVSEQAHVINSLQTELNVSEQYSRLSNLEIHGMLPTAGEDLNESVLGLATKLGLPPPNLVKFWLCTIFLPDPVQSQLYLSDSPQYICGTGGLAHGLGCAQYARVVRCPGSSMKTSQESTRNFFGELKPGEGYEQRLYLGQTWENLW